MDTGMKRTKNDNTSSENYNESSTVSQKCQDQDQGVDRLTNKSESQLQLYSNSIDLDFLTQLPLIVLGQVLEYVPLIDILITCHISPVFNDHISLLHDFWSKQWIEKCTYSKNQVLQSKKNWKEECECFLALLLKFSTKDMLLASESLYLKIHVTAIDYCEGMLICFGENLGWTINEETSGYIYKCFEHSWKLVTKFSVPALPTISVDVTSCCLIPGYKIIAGGSDGNLFVWKLESSTKRVILTSSVRAHASLIHKICADEDQKLDIFVTAGSDGKLRFWDLTTGSDSPATFDSFGFIFDVTILTEDRSPFVGYNCVLVTTYDHIGINASMICWGKRIPLQKALVAHKICLTDQYDRCDNQAATVPSLFVEGGSLVYGLRLDGNLHDPTNIKKKVFKLIWQPLNPEVFLENETIVSKVDIDAFRFSLHPRRRKTEVDLPEKTLHILGVGKYFSVSVTKYDSIRLQNLTLIVNSSGATEKLPYVVNYSGLSVGAPLQARMFSSEWLDGLDLVRPGSVCFIFLTKDGGFTLWTWKKAVSQYRKPTLTELLEARTDKRSILSSFL